MRMALRIAGRVLRSRPLARVVGAYALFILTEYAEATLPTARARPARTMRDRQGRRPQLVA